MARMQWPPTTFSLFFGIVTWPVLAVCSDSNES